MAGERSATHRGRTAPRLHAPIEGIDVAAQQCLAELWDRGWRAMLISRPDSRRPWGPGRCRCLRTVAGRPRGASRRVGRRPGQRRRRIDLGPEMCGRSQRLNTPRKRKRTDDDDDRWRGSSARFPEGYRDMELFIAALDDMTRWTAKYRHRRTRRLPRFQGPVVRAARTASNSGTP